MGISGLGVMDVGAIGDGEREWSDFMSSPSPVVSPIGKRSSGPETNFRIITQSPPNSSSSSSLNPSMATLATTTTFATSIFPTTTTTQQDSKLATTTTNNGNLAKSNNITSSSSSPTPPLQPTSRTRGRRGIVHVLSTKNSTIPNTPAALISHNNTGTTTNASSTQSYQNHPDYYQYQHYQQLISQGSDHAQNTGNHHKYGLPSRSVMSNSHNQNHNQNHQNHNQGTQIHVDGYTVPPPSGPPPLGQASVPSPPSVGASVGPSVDSPSGLIIPVCPAPVTPGIYSTPCSTSSSHGNTKSQSRWGRNSVTLPVPSPPTVRDTVSPIFLPETEGYGVRTLISTEAQTEDAPPPPPVRNRELRKRERRERRLRDRVGRCRESGTSPEEQMNINQNQIEGGTTTTAATATPGGAGGLGLPDLLNLPPPPYSTLPSSEVEGRRHGLPVSPPTVGTVPFILGQTQGCADTGAGERRERSVPPNCISPPPQPLRYHFSPPDPHPPPPLTRHTRRSFRSLRGIPYASEEEPKSCCGMSTTQAVSIRWFIIVIAAIGICCTVAGTALGAARSAGSQHLTLALLMIGVGVVLLTVSAVAWRLTANESGSSSCRAMLGFGRAGISRGDGGSEPNRVFVPRLPPSYGRPHHPYAAMLYPDFQYRPPPPSYQASMQEYRLRLLLLERSNPNIPHVTHLRDVSAALPHPPPPYRPYNQALIRPTTISRTEVELSRPPSYGSRISGSICRSSEDSGDVRGISGPREGRRESQGSRQVLGSEDLGSGDLSPVVTVMEVNVEMEMCERWDMDGDIEDPDSEERVAKGCHSGLPLDEHKDSDEKHRTELSVGLDEDSENGKCKDGNLVRIVQTTDSSQVIGRDSVIVTVSGSQNSLLWGDQQHQHHTPNTANNQVQILAHL